MSGKGPSSSLLFKKEDRFLAAINNAPSAWIHQCCHVRRRASSSVEGSFAFSDMSLFCIFSMSESADAQCWFEISRGTLSMLKQHCAPADSFIEMMQNSGIAGSDCWLSWRGVLSLTQSEFGWTAWRETRDSRIWGSRSWSALRRLKSAFHKIILLESVEISWFPLQQVLYRKSSKGRNVLLER